MSIADEWRETGFERANRPLRAALYLRVRRSSAADEINSVPGGVRGLRTWDQITAFVGHLDPETTRRHIHFMPKHKRATVESIPFEF